MAAWRWIHRWSSVACVCVLLVLALTGLPLIFHDELDRWLAAEGAATADGSSTALSVEDLAGIARRLYPDEVVQFINWDETSRAFVHMARRMEDESETRVVVLDASTGDQVMETAPGGSPLDVVLSLHRELLIGSAGSFVLGAIGVLFLVATISGVVLYGPFMRKLEFGTVRDSKARRIRWLDLHNWLGIATVAWVVVVGVTGVMNTLSDPLFDAWRAGALERLLGNGAEDAVPSVASVSPDLALAAAKEALPDREPFSLVFPGYPWGSPRHYLMWTAGTTPLTARFNVPVIVNATTGDVSEAREMPWYFRAVQLSRPLHFGDYGGWPLKAIWAAFDLALIAVLATGLLLLRRTP